MRIHIRSTDDWIAVYKDGKRVWNTHSCSLTMGLDALGIRFTEEHKDPEFEGDDMGDFFVEELPGLPMPKGHAEPDDDYHTWWHQDGTTR